MPNINNNNNNNNLLKRKRTVHIYILLFAFVKHICSRTRHCIHRTERAWCVYTNTYLHRQTNISRVIISVDGSFPSSSFFHVYTLRCYVRTILKLTSMTSTHRYIYTCVVLFTHIHLSIVLLVILLHFFPYIAFFFNFDSIVVAVLVVVAVVI